MDEVLVGGLAFPEAPRWRDGELWFSDFYSHRVLTVDLAGRLETVVTLDRTLATGQGGAYACMLGGPDRRTLFVLTNTGSGPGMAKKTDGRIEMYRVDVPGAGLP
jgi:sugar lactone lactonase YvrE